jgi:hypothetical protein
MTMTEKEIRSRAEQFVGAYVPNTHECHNLVERFLDLIEDVTEFDRDTAFEAGYDMGFADGQSDDDWPNRDDYEDDSRFAPFSPSFVRASFGV